MKAAWIKATEAWRDQGNHWRTVTYLIASERIAAGKSLSEAGTKEEMLIFLEHVRDSVPGGFIALIRRCPVIDEPVVEWHAVTKAPYYRLDAKSFSDRQRRISLYCSVNSAGRICKEITDIANHMWGILGGYLEKCRFDLQGGVYVELTGEDLQDAIDVQCR